MTLQYAYEFAIVGAGPAGLSAAIEAAKHGVKKIAIVDENPKPGGQLLKQIHKFFGSQEHRAGVRGIDIAFQMAKEAKNCSVDMFLNTAVWGIFEENLLGLVNNGEIRTLHADKILLATGASENTLAFPGWTLPGVIGAGAAQTMVNIHRVSIGEKILMVGSGNVGLIVSYQLMQAGAKVVAVVEILPKIGGYLVHASKIARLGVPILTCHTVKEVNGNGKVERATVVKVDSHQQPIQGTERNFDIDTVCIGVGLTPLAELAWICGCEFKYVSELGGWVPIYDENMETSVPGIYVAGDMAGIEEAATALMDGAIVGLGVAQSLGYLSKERYEELKMEKAKSLDFFRQGKFELRRIAKQKLSEKEGRVKQCLKE